MTFSFTIIAASPSAGDWVSYGVSFLIDGKPHKGQFEKRVEMVDTEKNQALVRIIQSAFPAIEEWVEFYALLYVSDTQEFCKGLLESGWSNRMEKVQVPAGEFMACRHEKNFSGYVIWYSSEVPFGFVKEQIVASDGEIIDEQVLEAFGRYTHLK